MRITIGENLTAVRTRLWGLLWSAPEADVFSRPAQTEMDTARRSEPCSKKIALRLSESRLGRAALHVCSAARRGHWRFHLAGVCREMTEPIRERRKTRQSLQTTRTDTIASCPSVPENETPVI
jgi:hypothetical protein